MDGIVELIRRRACLAETRDAERVAHAVLRTLSERISPEAAGSLAAQLPSELAEDLRPGGGPVEEGFELTEFVGRIAERANLPDPEAVHRAGVVLDVLGRETVHVADEVWDVLPEPLRRLVEAERSRVA
ncbi:DUF2267 domain-containing protein [Amycolatopsis circi]|uniref:DUF2267 domain-containing protein n=1 Tax=Amycolatopsis circi TaxID=871959 RepID=UPI000E235037|nr:DUF2267 domain-containing protein [Amycolatopsis circi]